MKYPLLALVAFSVLCLAAPKQKGAAATSGTIDGRVVDRRGSPIEGALVMASPLGKSLHTFVPRARTGLHGKFTVGHLPWGEYGVFAMKEEAGYPDTYFSLYSTAPVPTVSLSPASPHAELRLKLGPKAGILTGRVTDSATGKPISASFMLTREGVPHTAFGTSQPPDYRVLLPASAAVDLRVVAPGYQLARYRGLKLASGARMTLDIRLAPKAQIPKR